MRFECALVVEDDPELAELLSSFIADRAMLVHLAATKGEAAKRLREERIDLALIDLQLPDGNGLELLDLIWEQPAMPQVIVITGSATPDTAFRLAQAGVRDFVAKPVTLERLERACREILERPPDVRPLIRSSVGKIDLRAMEETIRVTMTDEALAVAGQSRRRASSLLGISRQLLQHILRER